MYALDPEACRAVRLAFDAVSAELPDHPLTEDIRMRLATYLLHSAARGRLDQDELCAMGREFSRRIAGVRLVGPDD